MKLLHKKLFLLVWVIKLAIVESNQNVTCGISKGPSGFVVRGQKFSRGDFPWTVALLFVGNDPPKFFCGGTLISATFVVTGRQKVL